MNQQKVEEHFRALMTEGLGFDINDPNLVDTPARIAKMYCTELFRTVGVPFPEEDFSKFPNTEKFDQIVMMDNIHFTSVCSHHFLPFSGKAWFLYQPNEYIMEDRGTGLAVDEHDLVGASKPARLIAHYAARPQLQENLCNEVINRFVEVMKPKGAMLVMRAIHGCMSSRGICQYNNAGMVSSAVYGSFRDATTRMEAMGLIALSNHPL